MTAVPASAGWDWIRRGFALFRQQPGGLFLVFLGNLLVMLLLGLIPMLGQLAALILMPVFTANFMLACRSIERGQRVTPRLLADGYRQPALRVLLAMGVLYVLAGACVLGLASLVDGGMLFQLFTGRVQPDAKEVLESHAGSAMLLCLLLSIPAMMTFWFAPPLAAFQRMPLLKALFYSFFAVWHALKAFLLFLLSWFGITLLCSQLILLVFGRSSLGMSLMTPLYIVLTIVLQCSLYVGYRQIFGAPEEPAPV